MSTTAAVVMPEEQRRKLVDQMRANSAIDGLHPDQESRDLEEKWVKGEVTIGDMINYVKAFAAGHKGK